MSIWFSESGVEETLVSSWIDLNFSIGLHVHVARAVSLQDLLEK